MGWHDAIGWKLNDLIMEHIFLSPIQLSILKRRCIHHVRSRRSWRSWKSWQTISTWKHIRACRRTSKPDEGARFSPGCPFGPMRPSGPVSPTSPRSPLGPLGPGGPCAPIWTWPYWYRKVHGNEPITWLRIIWFKELSYYWPRRPGRARYKFGSDVVDILAQKTSIAITRLIKDRRCPWFCAWGSGWSHRSRWPTNCHAWWALLWNYVVTFDHNNKMWTIDIFTLGPLSPFSPLSFILCRLDECMLFSCGPKGSREDDGKTHIFIFCPH